MKIPSSIYRIIAKQDIVSALKKFERDDLAQAENLLIISTSENHISLHYALLNTREAIGLLEQAKSILLEGELQ